MNTFCILGGIGFQELLLIIIFLVFFIGVPVALIVLIVKLVQKRNNPVLPISTVDKDLTPILKNAEKLKTLKALLEKGIISSDEFEKEKKQILGE
ncbi:MAG: SHOCT domain-containing protein [Cyclobacteriaceae bacterium]|nr:SHOCT domain-containing protein [Cyclobacteriaceae bacterium]